MKGHIIVKVYFLEEISVSSKKNIFIAVCLGVLLFGCTFNTDENNSIYSEVEMTESTENQVTEIIDNDELTEVGIGEIAGTEVKVPEGSICEQNDAYKLFYGTWEITQVVLQHRNQGDEGYEDILGVQVTYLPEMYGFGGIVKVNNPNYIMSIVPLNGHSYISDMTVSPYVKNDWFIFVEVADWPVGEGVIDGMEYGFEPYVGHDFFIIDDNTLYLFAYNCYYEMKRVSYMSEYDHLYDQMEGNEGNYYREQNSEYKLFYGTWEVTSIVSEHRRLGGDEGCEDILDMQVTYLPDYYEYGEDVRIDDPDYLISILPMSEVYLSWQEQSISALLPDNDYVVYIQVTDQTQRMEVQYMGTEFFIKDDNTLYCVANNCIYELTRVSYKPDYDPRYDTTY